MSGWVKAKCSRCGYEWSYSVPQVWSKEEFERIRDVCPKCRYKGEGNEVNFEF